MNFSETIKQYRERNRLTLRQLSFLSGVDAATLNRLERGLGNPRPKTVYAITLAMKLTPDEIDKKLNSDVPEPVNPDNNMHPDCSADVAYEFRVLKSLIERHECLMFAELTLAIITLVYIVFFVVK